MSAALKILIVEDDRIIGQDLEEQLLEMGYSITDRVVNGEEALLAFRRRIPDLVLMDVMLRDSLLDGIEIVKKINQIARVPVIYLTSLSDNGTRERAKETRPAYYLIKPWHAPQLETALDFALFNFVHQKEAEIKHSFARHSGTGQHLLFCKDFFFVKGKGNIQEKVRVDELLYVKGASESVELVTIKRKRLYSANLKSFSMKFDHPNLVRVHRSYIVNITKVEKMQDKFLLIKSTNIPVGPSYKEVVDTALNRLKSD